MKIFSFWKTLLLCYMSNKIFFCIYFDSGRGCLFCTCWPLEKYGPYVDLLSLNPFDTIYGFIFSLVIRRGVKSIFYYFILFYGYITNKILLQKYPGDLFRGPSSRLYDFCEFSYFCHLLMRPVPMPKAL